MAPGGPRREEQAEPKGAGRKRGPGGPGPSYSVSCRPGNETTNTCRVS